MATLKTKLTLDMKGFSAGLKRARMGLRKFGKTIGKPLMAGIKNVAAITAKIVALGVALAGLAINKIASLGDEIGKMSKRTGISTEELSRLKHAAELSGTSINALEKSTRKMQASIHEAGRGTKTYVDALASIGLEFKDLEKLSTEEQFDKTLKALADTENQTVKTAIAMQLFGRSGTSLLPMLADGAKGLEAMKKEAERLGLILTPEQVKQAELYKDQVARVKSAFTGLANSVIPMEAINRAMQVLIDKVVDLRQSGAFKEWADLVMQKGKQVLTVVFNLGKAIANFVQAGGENLRNFALIAGAVFLAFKSGLAIPLIKLLALVGKSFITLLVGPVGVALAAIVAIFAAYKIGKVLQETFDLGHYIALGLEHLNTFGRTVAAFFKSIGPNFKSEFDKATYAIGRDALRNIELLESMKGGNGKSFSENLKAEMAATVTDAKNVGKTISDALVPESVKGLLSDLGNLGASLDLPSFDVKLPDTLGADVGGAAERGIVKGLTNRRWGRVFTGEKGQIGTDAKGRALYEKNAKAQLDVSKSHTSYLRKMADNSTATWSFA